MANIVKTSMQPGVSQAMVTAIEDYKDTCTKLYVKVESELKTLHAGFQGDAAEGFDKYVSDVQPTLTTNLTGNGNSVCAMLESIAKLVNQLDAHDEEMGNANKGASGVNAAAK